MDDTTPPPPDPSDPSDPSVGGATSGAAAADDGLATPTDVDDPGRRRRKWLIGGAIALVVVVLLIAGGIFVYTQFLSDSDPELTTEDLSELVAGTDDSDTSAGDATASTAEPVATEPPTDAPATDAADDADGADGTAPSASDPVATEPPASDPGSDPGATGFDGTWVPTGDSVFGYRVEEVIAGVNVTATGRSNEIEGTLDVEGTTATVDIAVEVENITSDDSRRDSQFRGRIMEADEFPQATFVSTEPIEFGEIPADGEQITATATGDLTLKDVTNNVTFEVTAEASGDRIGVLGNIPILFEDYGIDNPSFGAIKTEDDGLLEFILVFEPA